MLNGKAYESLAEEKYLNDAKFRTMVDTVRASVKQGAFTLKEFEEAFEYARELIAHDEFRATIDRCKDEVKKWPAWMQKISITAESSRTGKFIKP